jgi:hypothetical protein
MGGHACARVVLKQRGHTLAVFSLVHLFATVLVSQRFQGKV